MQILDCTLRESGYHNNWQFSLEEIQNHINTVNADIVEIGFQEHCPDELIDRLSIPEGLQIAVMVRAANPVQVSHPKINLIRIATPYQKILQGINTAENLKQKGHKVALNITKVHSDSEIKVDNWDFVDILYLADTFGELQPNDVKRFFDIMKQSYNGTLGFHAHNDKGLALKNSLTAMDCGAEYIDATINGVGRGAGNLDIKLLQAFLLGSRTQHVL